MNLHVNNPVTVLALLFWPVVALWLYKTRPIGQATLWTILGAYLLLPVGADIKFEMIPQLDKSSIPNLAAFLGCMIVLRKPIRFWKGFGLAELLILMLIICPFITSELNGDETVSGGVVSPGVGAYDAASTVIAQFIVLLPFFLGRQFLSSGADTEEVLRVLTIAGLVYSLPILFEIRMSPQLHTWIYGYFPHAFEQQIREGGFRPVVFMGHGLLVAFFICTTAIAAAAFWRTGTQVFRIAHLPAAGITVYLSAILVLCKTVTALVYGAVLMPLVCFSRPKLQVGIALLLVTLALSYPILRATDLIPTRAILDFAASISSERSESLATRFTNENQLLERASQRFWFGWGRWGRSLIYDQQGNVLLTDGRWILTTGQFGFLGFLAEFGLLSLPVFRAASALRFAQSDRDKLFLAALTLISSISLVDLLPNASIRPWTWLLAGALLGRAEMLRAFARQQRNLWKSNLSPVKNS